MYKISLIAMTMFLFLTAGICLSQQVRFTDNENGTVTDTVTGLTWQQTAGVTPDTWQGALDQCNGLTLAGRSDWRLPNIKELESIVDDSTFSPASDPVFSASSSSYWSATSHAGSPTTNAWVVDFSYGHVDDSPKSHNGYHVRCVRSSIPTVTSSETGRVWMDRNLGASRVATAGNDEAAYGDLYQWGRGTDGHEKRDSGTNATPSGSDTPGHGDFITTSSEPYDWRTGQNDELWQGVSGTNNPCPSGFRLPTEAEWGAELKKINSLGDAYNSPLKLISAGFRSSWDGEVKNAGRFGYYWSSSVDDTYALYLRAINSPDTHNRSRANGFSVRCIMDYHLD